MADSEVSQGAAQPGWSAASVATIGVAVWHWFSHDQALAATIFSRKCGALEQNPPSPSADDLARGFNWTQDTYREHRSLVVASVLASAAFLEASINELFASAAHDLREAGAALPAAQRVALTLSADMVSRNKLLDRFQLALMLLGQEPFNLGAQPYQDASLLVRLRNELVHFKPQYRAGAGAPAPKGWISTLESKISSPSPFTGIGNPFFPDKCLGHGCTVWAWTAALNFCDDFFDRTGLTPVHDLIRDQLIP